MPRSIRRRRSPKRSAPRRSSRSKRRGSRRRYRASATSERDRKCLEWECTPRGGPDAKGIVYCHRPSDGAEKWVRVMDDVTREPSELENLEGTLAAAKRQLDRSSSVKRALGYVATLESPSPNPYRTPPQSKPPPRLPTPVLAMLINEIMDMEDNNEDALELIETLAGQDLERIQLILFKDATNDESLRGQIDKLIESPPTNSGSPGWPTVDTSPDYVRIRTEIQRFNSSQTGM